MQVNAIFFEHIITCLKNQKIINDQPPEVQRRWRVVIDEAIANGEAVLLKAVQEAGGTRLDGTYAQPLHNFSGNEIGQYHVDGTKSSFL